MRPIFRYCIVSSLDTLKALQNPPRDQLFHGRSLLLGMHREHSLAIFYLFPIIVYSPLPLGALPLGHGGLQSLGCENLIPTEGAVEHGRQDHGAVRVLLGETNLRIPAALLLGHLDGCLEQVVADALAPELHAGGPGADDTPTAPLQRRAAALLLPDQAGVGLEAEDESPDQGAAEAGAQDDILGALCAASPRHPGPPVGLLSEADVAASEVADQEDVGHGDAAGDDDAAAQVRLCAEGLVEAGECGGVSGEAERVEEDCAEGALVHLGDGVGDQAEPLYLVLGGLEGLEGQRRDVIVERKRVQAAGRGSGRGRGALATAAASAAIAANAAGATAAAVAESRSARLGEASRKRVGSLHGFELRGVGAGRGAEDKVGPEEGEEG